MAKHTHPLRPSVRTTSHDAPPRRAHGLAPDDKHHDVAELEDATPELSARLSRLIESLRADWDSYIDVAVPFFAARNTLASKFMKGFDQFRTETNLSFINYVRLFDPSVPKDADGYKKHSSYNAADYLRRLVAASRKPATARQTGPKPATPMDALARMVAVVLPLITANQVQRLWDAIDHELHWTERQVESLQARVKAFEQEPLVSLRPPHGQGGAVPQLRIATVRHSTDEDAIPVAASARSGTHG